MTKLDNHEERRPMAKPDGGLAAYSQGIIKTELRRFWNAMACQINKTEWEIIAALKQEKINSKATLEKLLEGASGIQREALLKGAEGKRQEALAVVQSLQQQIAVGYRDIKFLEEEQSIVEAMHIEFKLKEIVLH